RGEEDPAPADAGERAARDRAEREARGADRSVHRQGARAQRALGKARGDDAEPGRGQEGGSRTRGEPGCDEDPAGGGDPAEDRETDEDHERAEEDAAPPDEVGRSEERRVGKGWRCRGTARA